MARYIIETKQQSGQWLGPMYPVPSKTTHVANSKAEALRKAKQFSDNLCCPKRVVDTKSKTVLATFGDTVEYAELCKRLNESFEAKYGKQPK